ncbi:hypothetical protein [Paraburkholderia nemoris]|uniref:hypothetical protein n=1 Tax=Paraburkholderia nemoris TaxID=2793076 RepID=UPI00190C7984|nr:MULTISPECIES: hypothetical protein [Paraburkholderia]MBK3810085.1 hypothetical protein [Paraburkholderia aspalathi]
MVRQLVGASTHDLSSDDYNGLRSCGEVRAPFLYQIGRRSIFTSIEKLSIAGGVACYLHACRNGMSSELLWREHGVRGGLSTAETIEVMQWVRSNLPTPHVLRFLFLKELLSRPLTAWMAMSRDQDFFKHLAVRGVEPLFIAFLPLPCVLRFKLLKPGHIRRNSTVAFWNAIRSSARESCRAASAFSTWVLLPASD